LRLTDQLLTRFEGQKEKIGQLLIKHTSLTDDQLKEALDLQKESGMMVGQILLKKNYIHPHDIVKVICHQIEIPYLVDLKIDEINPELVNDLPINYAKQHEVLPFLETDYTLQVLVTDPFNPDIFNDLQEIFKKEIVPIVTSPLKIQDAINRVYEKANRNIVDSLEDEFDENLDLDGPIDILDAGADEAPVIRFVNSIIFRAVKEKASDIHVEPYEKEVAYRFRINGIMSEILRQPLKTQAAVSSRIKVMAKLDIAEKRVPQDGRISLRIAGRAVDVRVSTMPSSHGERVVLRLLDKNNSHLNLVDLGMTGSVQEAFSQLILKPHGIILVTGPTGSGKSTTLYAGLTEINTKDRNILTVEDPIEYELEGIGQTQVNTKVSMTFARGLRAILRQDPDVVMVGEIRDLETAQIAVQASLTGHLVLSTLHTNTAAGAITRLEDMGVEAFLLSSSLLGVLAQRLVRTLCPHCKAAHEPDKEERNLLGVAKKEGVIIYRAVGCEHCNQTGYRGRTGIHELLMVDEHIRELIHNGKGEQAIEKYVRQHSPSIRSDGFSKVLNGETTLEEVLRVTREDL